MIKCTPAVKGYQYKDAELLQFINIIINTHTLLLGPVLREPKKGGVRAAYGRARAAKIVHAHSNWHSL